MTLDVAQKTIEAIEYRIGELDKMYSSLKKAKLEGRISATNHTIEEWGARKDELETLLSFIKERIKQ